MAKVIIGEKTLVYNDLKYDKGDGVHHKAAFVRKITLKKGTQE